jgi:hypothetical protein
MPPRSGPRNSACRLIFAGFLLGLVFVSDDEAVLSSENSVNFYLTTRRYISEDNNLQVIFFSTLNFMHELLAFFSKTNVQFELHINWELYWTNGNPNYFRP